MPSEAVFVKE